MEVYTLYNIGLFYNLKARRQSYFWHSCICYEVTPHFCLRTGAQKTFDVYCDTHQG